MISSARNLFFFLLICTGFFACDENRVFEQNKDIPNHKWHKDSELLFEVDIKNPNIPYNIYYNIRNSVSYPARNLYLKIEIQDTANHMLTSDLNNIELFDPKTGEPYGDGLGDIFDHRVKVLDHFIFPDSGQYLIEVQHRMRDKILVDNHLPHILSVGIRIEKAAEEGN